MPQHTLHKNQRLKSELQIRALFASGKSFVAYPLRVVFSPCEDTGVRIMVSVPKRLFKRAVKRNLLKRRIREAYRLQQASFSNILPEQGLHIAFAYIAPEILPYDSMEHAMKKAVGKITTSLTPDTPQTHENE